MPLTVDLLQEDVVLRFLASKKSEHVDRTVISLILENRTNRHSVPELVNPNTVQVFSTLKNAPIAIAHHDLTDLSWDNLFNILLDQTPLENGLMRLRLDGFETGFHLEMRMGIDEERAWLTQAWSVFHALGITLEDDLANLQFTWLKRASLFGRFSQSEAKRQRRLRQPIYLFVYPLPSNLPLDDEGKVDCRTSSLHYWSFREDGQFPLSSKTCRYFGLPTTLCLYCHIESTSWNNNYKRIHRYQCLRGFDPTTADFARHLGYDDIVFRPVNDSVRFEFEESSEQQIAGLPELQVDSDRRDIYDSDDYTLTALFYTDPDDDTYTESAHVSSIQEREDLHKDSVTTSNISTQGLAVPIKNKHTTKTDHGADKRQSPGARSGAGLEGIERRKHNLDQVPECTTLFAPNAVHLSLPSISDMGSSSDKASLNIVLPTSSIPTQPTGLLAISHPEVCENGSTQLSPTHAVPNVFPVGSDTTVFMTDTPKDAGWSAMSQSIQNNALCDAIASNMASVVGYTHIPIAHAPANSTYSTEPVNKYVPLRTHCRDGGTPTCVPQQYWIPRPFTSNIGPIFHRSSWPVLATPRLPTSNDDNGCNDDGNDELD
ncbi:hypothetical protein PM082_013975 [Marasmius tenuissimus]|nr:hypothetical protein PM082_013975 [Marasmius tenuissimus]